MEEEEEEGDRGEGTPRSRSTLWALERQAGMQGEAEGDVEARRRGMGRPRRVMWRQADNPLAPRDKYEVRRTFSQPPGPPSAVESLASPAERRERERE